MIRVRRGHEHIVVGFTTTYAINAYHHWCDKVCQWLVTGRWFSLGPPVSSSNKTDHQDITEKLLKVALNTKQTNKQTNKQKAPSCIKPDLRCTEIVKHYLILPLLRGHLSYQATFWFQKGWPFKRRTIVYAIPVLRFPPF